MNDRSVVTRPIQRPIPVILVDDDPIFRLGFRQSLTNFPEIQVIAEAETDFALWELLSAHASTWENPPVILLELGIGRILQNTAIGLKVCQNCKQNYPQLPILIVTAQADLQRLQLAKNMGIDGYIAKGFAIAEIVKAIQLVADHQFVWSNLESIHVSTALTQESKASQPWFLSLRQSGLKQIDTAIQQINSQLESPKLSNLNWAVLAGQKRELKAARWLVSHLLPESVINSTIPPTFSASSRPSPVINPPDESTITLPIVPPHQSIFEATFEKIESSLKNLTTAPLEFDILEDRQKKKLMVLVLEEFQKELNKLKDSKVDSIQIAEQWKVVLQNIWEECLIGFYGKYAQFKINHESVEIYQLLLREKDVVQKEILQFIPYVPEIFNYFLFQNSVLIETVSYQAETPEAKARIELLLQNLLIEMANAVIQPLLNTLGEVEWVKQQFYRKDLISVREITRFRNDLSWKYRLRNLIQEPKAIFESRYNLWVFSEAGIRQVSIYSNRNVELAKLSGIPLIVTLALETRDAIAPRFRAVVAFLGQGVVYFLTQVVGRAIGLVGRGILQGVGNTIQETRYGKNGDRPR